MAFASGSITFKRFFVRGKGFERVDEAVLKQLSDRSINEDRVITADQTEIGWVTGDHILDTQFDFAKNAIADGLHFGLRIDTNKAPTEVVRSYQRMNEESMIEATGREFLTRPQRREAREQALSRADQEARSGRFRRMKQVPVFWDLKRNEVYLGSAGSTVIDHFLLLFRETFDLTLTAASSGELANRWVARTGEHHAFEDCRPAHFINPPEDLADSPDAPGQTDETASNDFLGTEWLTWLWYASHVESPTISVPGGDPVTVLFEKSLQMQCAFRLTGSMAINADAPTRLPEAMVALAGGKRPVRAAFQIERHGDVFGLAIRGDAMNFSSIRVPPPEEADSPRLVFEDRIEKLRDLISAIDDLYAAFLKRRLSGKWSQTLHAMRSWIGSNRPAGATTGHDTPALLEAAS